MGLTPTRVLMKYVIMYPVVGKSSANCGIGSEAVDDNLSTFPVTVPTLVCGTLVLGGKFGSIGVM